MYSGAEIIQDRLVFAASNYKPLKQLRDSWAAAASTWLNQYTSLKRAYDNELEKLHVRAAEVRAAAASRDARGHDDGTEPPPKRMRVRTSQVFKEHHPGSLTVNPGDMCVFLEACTNPRWSRVHYQKKQQTVCQSVDSLANCLLFLANYIRFANSLANCMLFFLVV